MDAAKLKSALADVTAEKDPTIKSLKMASLCSALWAEHGVKLVVVGGSAIEYLTDGAYASGDLDLCHITRVPLPIRLRQEIMGQLAAKGGPRNWQVAGMFVDVLGPVESFARTPYRSLQAPYGEVLVMKPEDLLVERVLVSDYPAPNTPARDCARMLAAVALRGEIEMNWDEVRRLAQLPEYRNLNECKTLIGKVADELKIKNPLHPD